MRKIHFLLFFSLTTYSAKAQIAAIFGKEINDSVHYRIGLTGDFGFNSTALTTKFLLKFYSGGYIDADTKDGVLERTRNKNRIGEDLNYGFFVAIKPDSVFHKKNINFFLSMRDREHFDARYSDDLYKVGFYGNGPYAGKTAIMNDFNLNFIRYQQLQLGFFKAKSDSTIRWGGALSFLKGEQYASVTAKTAELYTSEDGQYINFNTGIQVAQSDTAHRGIGAFNGYGGSVDLFLEVPLVTKKIKSKIRVSVEDLGAIQFNKHSLYLNQDSLFHYTGFVVNSITDLKDSTFGNMNKDSLINRVAPFHNKHVFVTLPTSLNVSFQTDFTTHFHLEEGIKYVYNSNYNLLVYVKGNFIINKSVAISASAGYGGYGKFNCGIGLFANFGKGIILYAGSNNIEGYIAQKSASGLGGYFSLIKVIK